MRRFLNFLGAADDPHGQAGATDAGNFLPIYAGQRPVLDSTLGTSVKGEESPPAQNLRSSEIAESEDGHLYEDEAVDKEIETHYSLDSESESGDVMDRNDRAASDCDVKLPSSSSPVVQNQEAHTLTQTAEDDLSPDTQLRQQVAVLRAFATGAPLESSRSSTSDLSKQKPFDGAVVSALRHLAETMVWADQNDPAIWDSFMEYSVMALLVQCLHASVGNSPVAGQRAEEKVDTVSEDKREQPEAITFENVDVVDVRQGVDPHQLEQELEEAISRRRSLNAEDNELGSDCHQENERHGDASEAGDSKSDGSPEFVGDPLPLQLTLLHVGDAEGKKQGLEQLDDSETKSDVFAPKILLDVQSQLLQTLSILVQSVTRQQSLFCLFASNHINEILSFTFFFEDEEITALFMSAAKSIALKLDAAMLQFFFDPAKDSFPLYSTVARFYDHPEAMIRIAVRNITLNIYSLQDLQVLKFAAKDEVLYFSNTVDLLAKLCGSVAKAFEVLLDDGREVRRTRSRTGIFQRKVRLLEVTAKLSEIENLCSYLGDVASVANLQLRPVVLGLAGSKLFGRFFRPIASQASPAAIRLLQKWRLSKSKSDTVTKPALPLFDATARCAVLAFVLTVCRLSPLGHGLVRDLCRPTVEFEQRHVLHGLKAMAANISGTERVTFVALCAIEAFVRCNVVTRSLLSMLKYDFDLEGSEDGSSGDTAIHKKGSLVNIGIPDENDLERSADEPLLMSLMDFEVPLTPAPSRPSTPTLNSMSSGTGTRRQISKDSRSSSFDATAEFHLSPKSPVTPATPFERSDSDGILTSFQFGEASLREAISSILLVVRSREVRTLRVVQAIGRIIMAVGARSEDTRLSIDVTKIVLDELAGAVLLFLKNKTTTIVSIEKMFDNFRSAAKSNACRLGESTSLQDMFSPEQLPEIISKFPRGAGKRRRALLEDTTPPIEVEDVQTLFVLMYVYESLLTEAEDVKDSKRLSDLVVSAITESGVDDSYLDKRDALENVGGIVLKHGEIE